MTPELPDDAYLRWLYSQVASARYKSPSLTYWSLIRQLYITEFYWFIPNDDNRVEDGRSLRYEFLDETGIVHAGKDWLDLPCSVLEMLIALSRRLAFIAEGQPRAWFWHLMRNLDLNDIKDSTQPYPEERIDDAINIMAWRIYEPDGRGGLFPLKDAHQDQTKVEIWYQMAAYLQQ